MIIAALLVMEPFIPLRNIIMYHNVQVVYYQLSWLHAKRNRMDFITGSCLN